MRTLCTMAIALTLSACGGGSFGTAEVTGAIGSRSFSGDVTAYHGDEFIVIVDTKIDCLDMAWVSRNYFGANKPTSGVQFGAVQFSFPVGNSPSIGTFFFDGSGDSPLDVWRVLNADVPSGGESEVDGDTAESYNLTITEVTEDSVVGEFDTVFADSNATGSFETVFCRNVR